tara:strand:- start:966 stop:1394 length:429 start_codon:yes stop_codon:yes gene_type:complete
MSTKNNVLSAIKTSWKDLQKSLTNFSYDKLGDQDSKFSNQVLNTLYEISLKEISVMNKMSSEKISTKKPIKVKSNNENIRASFRKSLINLTETHSTLINILNSEEEKTFLNNSPKRLIIDQGTYYNYLQAKKEITLLSENFS